MSDPNDQTLLSALTRFEGMALKYGPAVVSGVSGLADALGGSEPATPVSDGTFSNAGPTPTPIAARLHRAADFLNGVLNEVERHTARANVAVGAQG